MIAIKAYRGQILYTPALDEMVRLERGYVLVDGAGVVIGTWPHLPEEYRDIEVEDFGDRLLIPAFVDVHIHASQPPIQGLGHTEGSSWFADYCAPVERKYADAPYADAINRDLVRAIWEHGIMSANIMCTVHVDSAKNLFEHYVKTGMAAAIGKMNSDYGAFAPALESTEDSIGGTAAFVEWATGQSDLVQPSVAPEFAPACTAETMAYLGQLAEEQNLIVHSHMCEGDFDNEEVAKRFPEEKLYGKVYEKFGLFGRTPTAMAHCLSCTDEEIAMMADRGVLLAHCPHAILNDPAGGPLLPVRKFLDAGVPVGIGSDVGGSHTFSMTRSMVSAIQISKLAPGYRSLSFAEAFHMATKGGGRLFGKVGSFEPGYRFDALVIDDARWNRHADYSLEERLTRFVYCGDSRDIARRYCAGREVLQPETMPRG